ncbi:MAG: hypothetical protein IKP88_12835 [Lachnospiraceae bacterium]|nr:hypothetical protein [Lachnospiraceae bacterium]
MESKKLSFNTKMIFRDVIRNWPIWAVTIAIYLLSITGLFGLYRYFDSTNDQVAADIIELMMTVTEFASIILGFVVALAAFGYLGNKRKHYLYEVLPMNRMSMFFTRFLLGVIIMSIPSVIIYLVELIQVAAVSGYFLIGPLSTWLLINTVQNLFWFAFGTLFMVISGRKLMAGILYVAFSLVGLAVEYTMAIFNSIMFIGYGGSVSDTEIFHIGILSPAEYMIVSGMGTNRDGYVGLDGYFGVTNLIIVLAAAVVLIILGFILYKKRRAERTDDNLVFKGAKTVCAVIFTLIFSIEGLLVLLGLFLNRSEGISHSAGVRMCVIVLIILLSIAGYFIACMIIERRLKVVTKKSLIKALILSGILTLFAILYINDVFGIEKKVPKTDELAAARVTGPQITTREINDFYNEGINLTEEELNAITGLHKLIVDNMDELAEMYDSRYEDYYPEGYNSYSSYDGFEPKVRQVIYARIYIHYYLKNGKHYYKNYYISLDSHLYEKIKEYVAKYPNIFFEARQEDIIYYYD